MLQAWQNPHTERGNNWHRKIDLKREHASLSSFPLSLTSELLLFELNGGLKFPHCSFFFFKWMYVLEFSSIKYQMVQLPSFFFFLLISVLWLYPYVSLSSPSLLPPPPALLAPHTCALPYPPHLQLHGLAFHSHVQILSAKSAVTSQESSSSRRLLHLL